MCQSRPLQLSQTVRALGMDHPQYKNFKYQCWKWRWTKLQSNRWTVRRSTSHFKVRGWTVRATLADRPIVKMFGHSNLLEWSSYIRASRKSAPLRLDHPQFNFQHHPKPRIVLPKPFVNGQTVCPQGLDRLPLSNFSQNRNSSLCQNFFKKWQTVLPFRLDCPCLDN